MTCDDSNNIGHLIVLGTVQSLGLRKAHIEVVDEVALASLDGRKIVYRSWISVTITGTECSSFVNM